ncbi:MAG: glycine/sarcosine/betaine reductase component B subunit [Actinomycetota bacterium]
MGRKAATSGSGRGGERQNLALRRLVHRVESLEIGNATSFDHGNLTVVPDAAAMLFDDPAIARVTLQVAAPGDRVRIVKVLDSVEPRTKGPGGGGIFPGFVSAARPQGRGDTHVLRGMAVVVAGYLPRAQEGLVEMRGDAAAMSPLGDLHNLVVEFEPAQDARWEDVDAALRLGALRLAAAVAAAALEAEPDEVEVLPSDPSRDGLPRIGAVTNLQTQGSFKDVFVYGRSFSGSLPTVIDPNELDDGAVVSGQYGHPGLKNPTYVFQNHPVVAALRARDGTDLTFAGLVISPEPVDQTQKELVSAHAARLCRALGFDAAIITKEGGGNADADVTLKMDAFEDLGVVGIGILNEMSGPHGTGPPLVVPPERAKSLISTGNYDERLELGEVDRALGGDRIDIVDAEATAAVAIPTAALYGSLNPLGWGRLTAGIGGTP